jgi:transcriptional regulator with XRE-family HTH domain
MSADILHFIPMTGAPNRIRELRMARNMSQQAVADLVGVSKVTISDLERGEMRLDVEYMKRIAAALSVPPHKPVTAADLLPPNANPWSLDEDEQEIIMRYRMANKEQRQQVQRMADVIIPWKPERHDAA